MTWFWVWIGWEGTSVLFDFIKMKISFKKDDRIIELKEIVDKATLHLITAKKVHKDLKEDIFGFFGTIIFYHYCWGDYFKN